MSQPDTTTALENTVLDALHARRMMGGVSTPVVAMTAGISPSSARRTLNRLADRGLVEREFRARKWYWMLPLGAQR